MDISAFAGKALIVDCSSLQEGDIIQLQVIEDAVVLDENDFIIFYTGWSKKWGAEDYFGNYPVISQDLANKLAGSNIKGIGLDVISIDPVDSKDKVNHKIILAAGKIIIENLTNLEQLLNKQFTLSCFPLNIKDGDGSPVRAVAIIE